MHATRFWRSAAAVEIGVMKVVVGDETGLIKVVDLQAKQYAFYGEQARHLGVVNRPCLLRCCLHFGDCCVAG